MDGGPPGRAVIHFVVAVGPPGAGRALDDALRQALEDTTLLGGELVEARSPTDTWRFAAIWAPDPFLGRRWHVDGEHLVVGNGPVTGAVADLEPAAVLERFRRGGADAAIAPLRGTYNLLCLSPDRGLAVRGDFAGASPLYHGRGRDVVVLSNRATTVSHVVARGGWDAHPLGWIIGHSALNGSTVPPRGASVLPPGRIAGMAWGENALVVETAADRPWLSSDAGSGRPDLSPAEWDGVTDALLEEVRGLRRLDTPLYLGLTGGKDSRLLLALLKAAGMTEVETYTSGGSAGGEVACAEAVARAAGFPHRTGSPLVGGGEHVVVADESDGPPRDRSWHRMARAETRYQGIVSLWSAVKNSATPGSLVLNGWGGELYRRGRRRWRDGRTMTERGLAWHLRHFDHLFDPLGILLPDERRRQLEWIDRWVAAAAADIRLDLLPDAFYLERRLTHWAGPLTQDLPARITAMPLLSPVAARKYAELDPTARGSERLHYEVMRRAAPELVALPFLGDVWPSEIRRRAPEPLATAPFGEPPRPAGGGGPADRYRAAKVSTVIDRYRATRLALRRFGRRVGVGSVRRRGTSVPSRNPAWPLVVEHAREVDELFRAAAPAGLDAVCDVEALRSAIRRPEQLDRDDERIQVVSAMGAALLWSGRGERVVHEPVPPR